MLVLSFLQFILFPDLFPGFGFDTPLGYLLNLIVFQTGIFSPREIRCGFQHDNTPDFLPPPTVRVNLSGKKCFQIAGVHNNSTVWFPDLSL